MRGRSGSLRPGLPARHAAHARPRGLQTELEQYSLQDWDLKRRVLPLVDLAEEVHDDIRDARKREKEGTE